MLFHHVLASVNLWNNFGEPGRFFCELNNCNHYILGILFRLDSKLTNVSYL